MSRKHHLSLEAINGLDECNLTLIDTSKYDSALPLSCSTLNITAPGFNHPATIQVEPGFTLNLTGKDVIRLTSSDRYCFETVKTPESYECPTGYVYDPELEMCKNVIPMAAVETVPGKTILTTDVAPRMLSSYTIPNSYAYPIKIGGSLEKPLVGSKDSTLTNIQDSLIDDTEAYTQDNSLSQPWLMNLVTDKRYVYNSQVSSHNGIISYTKVLDLESDGRFTFLLGSSGLFTLKINDVLIIDMLDSNASNNTSLLNRHLMFNIPLSKGDNIIEFTAFDLNSANTDLTMMFDIFTTDVYRTMTMSYSEMELLRYWSLANETKFNTGSFSCSVGYTYNYLTGMCENISLVPPTVIASSNVQQCVEKTTDSCLPCENDITPLNDGVYVIKYTVNKMECHVEYNHLRYTKAKIRLAKALCEINLSGCEPTKKQKEKLRELFDIQMMLEAAKSAVEICHDPDKGLTIYSEALNKLNNLDCKTCK